MTAAAPEVRVTAGTVRGGGEPDLAVFRGIPFAEHNPEWHHKAKVKPEVIAQMYAALE